MIDSIHPSATLADDGIPLHFGDLQQEYHAALEHAVLMDRSHEGRFELRGRDRLEILHRISTNDLTSLPLGEARPTLFTNANARILDRSTFVNRGETALALTEPGRGEALRRYLQRNIFFNDEALITDLSGTTRQYVLHGAQAEPIGAQFAPGLPLLHSAEVTIAGVPVLMLRDKPLVGSHWRFIVPNAAAADVWAALLASGAGAGLVPAGSLAYNLLRIHAGRPGVGHELSAEYIPLEVGLWDEVSFTKGCYTGQEIIARMESRGQLARTMVSVSLSAPVEAPALLRAEGRDIGALTSSAQAPNGELFGIGVVRVAAAVPGAEVLAGDGVPARITARIGAQPPYISDESE